MLNIAAAVFGALLLITGLAKFARPGDTATAIRALGLPASSVAVRGLALTEATVGIWAITTMRPLALSVQSLLYVTFALWVVAALRSGSPLATCGCLGRPDTPPYWGHLLVNILGAVASAGAALGGGPLAFSNPMMVVTATLIVGIGVFLSWSLLGVGAQIHGMVRR